ncbi:MAG: hypothetical protein R3E82_07360 [Pseudomonadales bacterium]|nr:hypothetical protein [Pseudomonadales bacterium]
MSWIVIAVVVLAAFGPVLWILPSRKDRRLAALRAKAREEGLVVDLRSLPKRNAAAHERVSAAGQVRDPVVEVAAYTQGLERKLRNLPVWRLQRGEEEGETGNAPREGWIYLDRPTGKAHVAAMLELADPLLAALPADVLALEVAPRSLLIYWLEGREAGPEQVGELAARLREFGARLLALDERISARSEDEDS